jgi:hypothetical protein
LSDENPLTAKMRPHVEAIKNAIVHGDQRALDIRNLYVLYVACPNDHAAAALCRAALDVWLKQKGE